MEVRISTFAESERDIRNIRNAVFSVEQGVPEELDWDGKDDNCSHAIAVSDDGKPVGTGRIAPDGKIGRMAVLKSHRGQGIGALILDSLITAARTKGITKVYLHSQLPARRFYEKHDFVSDGGVFVEAGIEHVRMSRVV